MNRNNMALFGVVAFLVIGLGLTALLLMRPKPAPEAAPTNGSPAQPPARKAWVAARDIPPRAVFTREMLTEGTSMIANGIADPNQVIGKLSKALIAKGEPVTSEATIEPLHRVIPANIKIPTQDPHGAPADLRGVAIWVDPNQTAAGLVDKGDHVDVIVAHKLKVKSIDGDSGDIASGRTIAEDLEVLAVDRSIAAQAQPTPPAGAPGAPAGQPAPPPAPTPPPQPGQRTFMRVVLAAAPDVAERLVAANVLGELHLTIRDPLTPPVNNRLAEALEYPTHTVDPFTRKRIEARIQEESSARQARLAAELARENARQQAEFNRPPVIPQPVTSLPTPMPPPVSEITVVRGTEKTRVVVPR